MTLSLLPRSRSIALLWRRVILLGAGLALIGAPAHADKTDRNQPLSFVADSAKVDELKQTNVLSGNVEITKGTIVIRADRVEVRQSREGYQSAVATGWPNKRAFFRQKREGSDEYLEGEAERMEYDSRNETVRLFNQAVMRRFRGSTLADEVTGNTIAYDNVTEVFQVLGSTSSTATPGRVRGVLTPRDTGGAAASAASGASQPEARP